MEGEGLALEKDEPCSLIFLVKLNTTTAISSRPISHFLFANVCGFSADIYQKKR
jgi:hypothetical protein